MISVGGAKPIVVHQYIVSDLRNTPPLLGWPETNDDQLIDAMIAPLCTAYVYSC